MKSLRRMCGRRWLRFLLWSAPLVFASGAAPGQDVTPTPLRTDDAALALAIEARDHDEALRVVETLERARPNDPFVRYNRACVHALRSEAERSIEALLDAVSLGFVDFDHMARDEHLAPIRQHPKYQLILRGRADLLEARVAADIEEAREKLGGSYTFERDPALRLVYASALAPTSFADAKQQIARVVEWTGANIPPLVDTRPDAAPATPEPWVMVILPTPEDFAGLVGRWGVGGIYDRDHKRLVSQDIGPSLRHEFFHVLHHRFLDRTGQKHPLWIMEGLASLLEDVETDTTGQLTITPSWRTNIAKRLERAGKLTPWDRLASMKEEHFMGQRARGHYAQSRAVFMFLHERGALAPWFDAYSHGFAADASGVGAIERAMGVPIKQAEKAYRAWLRELPPVAEISRPAEASLGVEIGPGTGDGVEVLSLRARSRALNADDRLRRRDIVTAINGREVRTLDDYHRVMGELRVGQTVEVALRRGALERTLTLELVEHQEVEDPLFP